MATGVLDQAAVTVRNLSVYRGATLALDAVSLAIPRGSVVGLLGPSGGGKTTLMRSIVGAQIITAGVVTVLGLPAGTPTLRGRVGYVTQAPSVYPDLTARENLRYFATIVGAPPGAVDDTLEAVGLTPIADRPVVTYSGGQRSRVTLGAALVGKPELLVLDEPTVGLDPVLRRDLWNLFHSLAAQGTTLLVSSHVMDEAARCDRLIFLREGRVLADDTLPALLAATGASDAEHAFLALAEQVIP